MTWVAFKAPLGLDTAVPVGGVLEFGARRLPCVE